MIMDPTQPRAKALNKIPISGKLMTFLDQLLQKDKRKRPDAATCLKAPWFEMFSKQPPILSAGVAQCLHAYMRIPELKKAMLCLMAHQCPVPACEELREIFTHFES